MLYSTYILCCIPIDTIELTFFLKNIYLIQIHQNWWNYIDYLSLVFFPHDSARQSNIRFEL